MSKPWRSSSALKLAAALLAVSGSAFAATHKDKDAGLSYEIPFKKPEILSGADVEAQIRKSLGDKYPDDLQYTSGVYEGGALPSLIHWVKKSDGPITKELADAMGGSGGDMMMAALGISHFQWKKTELRGEGRMPEMAGLKIRVLIQLVKNQYSYVGFYYKKDSDLALFDKVKKSLKVLPHMKLRYAKLPRGDTGPKSRMLGILVGAIVGAVIGAAAYLVYRRMKGNHPGGSRGSNADGGMAA